MSEEKKQWYAVQFKSGKFIRFAVKDRQVFDEYVRASVKQNEKFLYVGSVTIRIDEVESIFPSME